MHGIHHAGDRLNDLHQCSPDLNRPLCISKFDFDSLYTHFRWSDICGALTFLASEICFVGSWCAEFNLPYPGVPFFGHFHHFLEAPALFDISGCIGSPHMGPHMCLGLLTCVGTPGQDGSDGRQLATVEKVPTNTILNSAVIASIGLPGDFSTLLRL